MPAAVSHVGFNALFLAPGVSGGPETYVRGLLPALARARPAVRLSIVTSRAGAASLRAEGWGDWAHVESLPMEEGQTARRAVCEQALLPLVMRRRAPQLLHSLANVAPLLSPVPSVLTLHDVIFFRHRSLPLSTTLGMRFFVARGARKADALIAVSAAARDEICAVLGLDPGRFVIARHGVGEPARPEPGLAESVRARYGLDDRRVVLCVAAKRAHKNQELLVRALRGLPADVLLCCAGQDEGYGRTVLRVARELGVEERLRLVDYVPDADLEALWGLAACAAFPTRAEGFGLPVLEAMRRSVPLACSDIPVLREVAGDAASYFDPADPEDAARAISLAMEDGAAAERGRKRAATFRWEDAAEATFEAYERALRRSA